MASYPYYTTAFTSQQHDGYMTERLPSGVAFSERRAEIGVADHGTTESLKPGPFPFAAFPYLQEQVTVGEESKALRCLPLLDVSVDVDVLSTVSRTSLTQTFANFSDITIAEANYSFPLYDGAAVISFRCTIGDEKMLEGKIKPKTEARAEYKKEVAEQRVAALLEEHTPEVFETHLGNIPPRTTVKVDIAYVNELKLDIGGEGVLVTVPTSIAPRYGTPPPGHYTGSSPQTSQTGLRIVIHVTAPVPIQKLESRSHPISVEMGCTGTPTPTPQFSDLAAAPDTSEHDPKKARATLSDRSTTLGRDFVLLVLSAGSDLLAPRALMEPAPGDGQSAVMVTISPRHIFSSYPSMARDFKGEIIFVADRSGSMAGAKMAALREALRIFLKSLPNQCHFNIYSFGSTHSSLWKQSSLYSEQTLNEAMRHVSESFHANLGGTELLPALRDAARQRMVGDGLASQIILVTDGEVWNTDDTIGFVQDFCKESQNTVRFFALGIGDAVSHQLIEGVGRVGGGFGEVVAVDSQGKWESRVLRLLKGALMSTSWNCELELDGLLTTKLLSKASAGLPNYVQAPHHIPPVHSFARQPIFFLMERQVAEELKSMTVKTTTPSGQRLSVTLPVERAATPWNILHNLAAKAVIMDLESGRSYMQAENSTYGAGSRLENAVRREAERLGAKYHVTSKWTSFVATESERGSESATRIYKAQKLELTSLLRPRHLASSSFRGARAFPRELAHGSYKNLVPESQSPRVKIWQEESIQHGGLRSEAVFESLPYLRSPAIPTVLTRHVQDMSYGTCERQYAEPSDKRNCTGVRLEVGRKQVTKASESSAPPCSLSDLVAAQSATGSFPRNPSFSAQVIREFNQDVATEIFTFVDDSDKVYVISDIEGIYEIVYTVISIFLVRKKFPESQELWELMISKAEGWLAQQIDEELRLQLFQVLERESTSKDGIKKRVVSWWRSLARKDRSFHQ